MPDFSPRPRLAPKGWLESWLDSVLLRSVVTPRSWWSWPVTKFARFTLRLGMRFPWVYRPWFWLGSLVRQGLDERRHETALTIRLRRLFPLRRPVDGMFRPSFAIINWITLLFVVSYINVPIEIGYAYGTYPFGTYRDVIVTQAYRSFTDPSVFDIHGYYLTPDGEKHAVFFELGSNVWFWNLYPEFLFGQIPIGGRCKFDTYGLSVRVGKLYALNPWIVHPDCVAPVIVAPESSHA